MSAPSESTPLLQPEQETVQTTTPPPQEKRRCLRWPQLTNPQAINAAQCFLIFSVTFGLFLASVPQLQLLEGAVCKEYYANRPATGDDEGSQSCKIAPIQARIARLTGASSTLEIAAELIIALPMGRLADRIGKRPVLLLAALSSMLSSLWSLFVISFSGTLPVTLILGSFVPRLLGGGETVLLSMLYAITADIAPAVLRANYFLQLSVASFLGQSLGALCASLFLDRGFVWLPALLCYAILPTGLLSTSLYSEAQPKLVSETPVPLENDGKLTIKHRLTAAVRAARSTFSIISSPSAAFIMFTFALVVPVSMCIGRLLILLVTARFHWTLAQAGYLMSIRGFGDIFVFLVLIPVVTKILMSDRFGFRYSTAQKDLTLAKAFLILLTVGTTLLTVPAIPAVVGGVFTITLGFGWMAMCRSLMVAFVDESQLSQLYSLIGMVESIGSFVGQPSLSGLYSLGTNLGPPWEILPFTVVAFLCLTSTCLLFFVRIPGAATTSSA